MFQIPKDGGDPPFTSDDEARFKRRQLGEKICGSAYRPKRGISVSSVLDGLVRKTLTGNLALRAFFMCTFHSLLFQTPTHISGLRM